MSKCFPVVIALNNPFEAELEMLKIGADVAGAKIMRDKAVFRTIKIKNLTPPQANIIKQELLSCGADAATSRSTITAKTEFTDIILFATIAQFRRLVNKLKANYFNLPQIAKSIEQALANFDRPLAPMKFGKIILDFKKHTYIMGIINVTPDSFSDGGKHFNHEKAILHAKELIYSGADIIDIGGESTRPGAKPISTAEELKRILPVVKALARFKNTLISVDTRKSIVAEKCLAAGAHIINDISALTFDRKMAKVIAKYNAAVILMHMQGTPETMQKNPRYKDIVFDILSSLSDSIEIAKKDGILSDRIIVDPGFGFGKALEHNLLLLKHLKGFKTLGFPIMVGTSRKSMIGQILDVPADKRVIGTAATNAVAILNGANIIRVHDVLEMSQVVKVIDSIIRRNS